MRTVAFVPIKLENRRFPGKNLKLLGDRPLLHWLLESLLRTCRNGIVDEVYVYSSADLTSQLPAGVKFLRRDARLDCDEILSNDLVRAFTAEVSADIHCLGFVTTPFLEPGSITQCVERVRSGEHDSALTVRKQYFTWYRGRPITYDHASVPRTQDMEPAFVETLFYAFRREFALQGRRIGDQPWLQPISEVEAVDIDYEADLRIAQACVDAGVAVAPWNRE